MCRGDWFGGFADIAREKLIFILLRNAEPERLTADGKRRGTAEIRVAAGPDYEVGVKRYAYCCRNLFLRQHFKVEAVR